MNELPPPSGKAPEGGIPSWLLYDDPERTEAGAAMTFSGRRSVVLDKRVERVCVVCRLELAVLARDGPELSIHGAVGADVLHVDEERRPHGRTRVVALAVLVGVLEPHVERLSLRIDEDLAERRVGRDLRDACRLGCRRRTRTWSCRAAALGCKQC